MTGKTPWWALVAGAFMFMLLASSLLQAVRDLFTYAVIGVLIVAIARLVYVIRHERAVAEKRHARERAQRRGPRRQGAMALSGLDAGPASGQPRYSDRRTRY
ncbi:hypothetical protein ACFVMC_31950 [Nocardia sp. NPDC127579]|uniref:hypothetical protein n=1 Tax=Nocardia sp. NPDC127579 TaxID=3345402 RepID=UPI003638CC7B